MRKSGMFLLLGLAVFMFYGLYVLKGNKSYIDAAFIAEGFQVATGVKQKVAEHYQLSGKLPSSNAELDMAEPYEYSGKAMTSLEVSEGGVITLTYNEHSGVDGGTVQFIPKENKAVGLHWLCITPSYENIEKWAPQCTYEEPMLDGEEILEFIDRVKK